ncbi:MAG: prepilin-type N-terminal cleavage/methylation domain-containing protein [Minisyncoccota bacterium]
MAKQRGFTLIELLVVIAIIGILSAVVLASLNTARSKGNDAAIQSNLSTIRTQAEIYRDSQTNNSYGTNTALESNCAATDNMFSNSNIGRAAAAANAIDGGNVTCNVSAGGTAYAVSARLVTDTTKYWCVDSSSVGTTTTTALGSNTNC